MSQQKFKIYKFQPYNQNQNDSHSHTMHISTGFQSTLQMNSNNNNFSYNSNCLTSNSNIDLPQPWRPLQRLRKLHTQFQNTILYQNICIPCAFCGKLLYPTKAKWPPYNENYIYPLEVNFQNRSLYMRGEGSARIVCVCKSCKDNRK